MHLQAAERFISLSQVRMPRVSRAAGRNRPGTWRLWRPWMCASAAQGFSGVDREVAGLVGRKVEVAPQILVWRGVAEQIDHTLQRWCCESTRRQSQSGCRLAD